ncbi:MAG: C40 family peptidase [Parachlamydiaceae bacterium]|nr:C40 family peptidase [Parachlamydiaceae bacterium]
MISNLLLATTLSIFNYVNAPVAEMFEEPKEGSELVSQAYYSEPITILEEAADGWVKIQTNVDNYQGWAKKSNIFQRENAFLSDPSIESVKVNRCAAHIYRIEDTIYGPLMTLPFESRLALLSSTSDTESRWLKVALLDGREAYIQRGDVTFKKNLITPNEMCLLSLRFLDLPYTWAGRSSFGYDCSGFTQMLYRQMGIYLPRDSKDQIQWEGFTAIPMDKLQAGDLVFFGRSEEKFSHVAMFIGDDRIIHPNVQENAPYLRITRLSDDTWNGSGVFKYRAARTARRHPILNN